MKRGIKAVVFDVGGVFVIPKKPIISEKGKQVAGVFNYVSDKLKIPLDKLFDSMDTSYAKSIENKISREKALSVISKNLEIKATKLKKLFYRAYKRKFKQNKQLYRLAFKLKKQGYKIAILSDQWYLSKEALMLKRLTKKFDAVVVSCDVGIRKPDPKIYKMVLKKLKLPAKKTIFIDDREWNIKPARKLGFNTILFKNNEQTIKALEKMGVR